MAVGVKFSGNMIYALQMHLTLLENSTMVTNFTSPWKTAVSIWGAMTHALLAIVNLAAYKPPRWNLYRR